MFDLPDPIPRPMPLPYCRVTWPVRCSFGLRAPVPPSFSAFQAVLGARRSVRDLSPAPLREVANMALFACAASETWGAPLSRSRRPSHSAGALHPIEVLFVSGRRHPRLLRCDPDARRLELIRTGTPDGLCGLVARARDIVPSAKADLIVLVGDRAKTAAVYDNPDALLWRDAGALMQTLHLCAVAFRLGLCPLGINGGIVGQIVSDGRADLVGLGVAYVGRPNPP